ncbi:MAG: DUF2905 family protein [Gammaproteobacteria bacterium]|nr:DUF2905 family protein [Gammaproteobacteria bacterium]
MRQILIGIGILLIAVGLLWPWLQKFGLFRLPGDIVIEREHFRFYFPITSMLLISLLITLLLWLFRK